MPCEAISKIKIPISNNPVFLINKEKFCISDFDLEIEFVIIVVLFSLIVFVDNFSEKYCGY